MQLDEVLAQNHTLGPAMAADPVAPATILTISDLTGIEPEVLTGEIDPRNTLLWVLCQQTEQNTPTTPSPP